MEIFISIDGVLRNTIAKFDYHYKDYYLDSEEDEKTEEENKFDYGVIEPVKNEFLLDSYKFQSKDEFNNFLFLDYSVEIFGHANPTYKNVFHDLNTLIYKNKEHRFTVIGIDELGKSKPSTLFYLSRNGFMGNNVRFSISSEIDNLWKKCDLWITDNKSIIDSTPRFKKSVKFNNDYNQYFTNKHEIHKLTEIDKTWLKSSGNIITSTWTRLMKSVK
jgi:hypothetical protein|tara:strand:- start:2728 stop:3378 length:651 start_codon:yes stop_codon:yes gene_type:complete